MPGREGSPIDPTRHIFTALPSKDGSLRWTETRGRVVARDAMTLTLVCDHRILYGADGAKFLARVRELLVQPLSLAL